MNRAVNDLISRAEAKDFVRSKRGAELLQHFPLNTIIVLKLLDEIPTAQGTVEPKRIDLPDETKAWLDKMDAVDALGNIADICIDWDGYRTADGLGGLINEIWAYARYCADNLLKAQEPIEPKKANRYIDFDGEGHPYSPETYDCGACGKELPWKANYCPECGRAVKWGG